MTDLQAQIVALRKRLRSLSINEISRPSKSSTQLPNQDQFKRLTREFSSLYAEVNLLPTSAEDVSVDVELKSLKAEVEASADLMKHIERLANLSDSIRHCDAALSDLLEHIDSFPASPQGTLLSSHQTVAESSPEEQLSARMSFARNSIQNMSNNFASVAKDSRAISERSRILQTWGELEEMGNDRLGGQKSRPGSTISSRPSSGRGSATVIDARSAKKASAYSNLSVSSVPAQKRLLIPTQPTPRRAVSGSDESRSRPDSRLSIGMSSNRSVSSSLYGTTFASRQRTASLSNSTSTPVRYPSGTPMRSRAQTGQVKRSGSPTASEASSFSRSVRGHSRSSTSLSSWSRAPRNSLSSILPRGSTPQKTVPAPRKTYVADPKNKLDVAVGDVVNKLPVGINIEGVSETWKDQSGKYWIGNQDPKLCFCRILRSQTVMVRVGGGWTELSKYAQLNFPSCCHIDQKL
jgi:Growth-Arrest-Specific Protein 2 Domain